MNDCTYANFFEELKNSLNESTQILGSISRHPPYEIKGLEMSDEDTVSDNDRKDELENKIVTWGYVPEIEQLTFFVKKPTMEELQKIQHWLLQNGYNVKKCRIPKIGMNEESSSSAQYCGILLDKVSQDKLKFLFSKIVPEGWKFICHHMTIDPFGICSDETKLGKSYNLMATAYGISDKACAIKVVGYDGETKNEFPHITIAVNEKNEGKPKDSNKITKWIPLTQNIVVTGNLENIS